MRTQKFFVLCVACVVIFIIAVLAKEYFQIILSILITAFVLVLLWRYSDKKRNREFNLITEKLTLKLEASEYIRQQLFNEHVDLIAKYNNNLELLKVIKEKFIKRIEKKATFPGVSDERLIHPDDVSELNNIPKKEDEQEHEDKTEG